MAYKSFEDLDVWQRSCRLAVEVFEEFRGSDFINLKNQIERSALSIASNVAEGAERGGAKEFSQFLKNSQRVMRRTSHTTLYCRQTSCCGLHKSQISHSRIQRNLGDAGRPSQIDLTTAKNHLQIKRLTNHDNLKLNP